MAITCSSSSLICFSSESTSRSSSLNLFYSKPNIIIRTHLVFYPRNQKRLNFSVSDKWRNRVSFFSGFSTNRVESLKEELFQAIKPLDRGAEASPEDQARVDQVILLRLFLWALKINIPRPACLEAKKVVWESQRKINDEKTFYELNLDDKQRILNEKQS